MPLIRWFLIGFFVLAAAFLIVAGPRGVEFRRFTSPPIEIFPDMDRQRKFKSQSPTRFFDDGRIDRMSVSGTVPMGIPIGDPYFATGKMKDRWGDGIPMAVDAALVQRGAERYAINCQICHGETGAGNGITSQYGLNGIATLLDERIQKMADGEIFNTITHGKGLMGAYPHINVEDRWAIIAYVRALQVARTAKLEDVPEAERANLK